MKAAALVLAAAAVLRGVSPCMAGEAKPLELHGYYKNFLTAFVRPLPGRPVLGADSNRFRLNASKETPGMQWYLSYTVSPRV
ncbi:MAG: hypothetical protein ACYC5N_10140, partial [Endomicrobiales bacterium]